MKDTFEANGYHLDRGLFSSGECKRILHGIRSEAHLTPFIWEKGCAATIPSWAALARNDRLVDTVAELIGKDVILWGANLVVRFPNQVHHWHNDLESCGSPGFVSVWMGLRKTDADTSLKVIPGSHQFEKLLYQFASEQNVAREAIGDEKALEWSKTCQPDSHIEYLDTGDGDALLFDGRLWHGSNNRSRFKERIAVLLQYARADLPVRIPKFGHARWPMEQFSSPKPPCLIVRGSSRGTQNTIMPGPPVKPIAVKNALSTLIEPLVTRPDEPGDRIMKSFPLFKGPTPDISRMGCHYSTLAPGKRPHEPHIHDEEETLIIIKGEAELITEKTKGSNDLERHPAKPGDCIYYPANWRHTLENTADQPVLYLMFKWQTDEYHSKEILEKRFVKASETLGSDTLPGGDWNHSVLLEGKTEYLRKLHVHCTRMRAGKGYEAHADAYDVGIVLFAGQIETLGETVTAPALVFYAAGELHGLRCIGDTPAKYVVFEFHGKHGDIYETPGMRRRRKLIQSITNPRILINHLAFKIKRKLGKVPNPF